MKKLELNLDDLKVESFETTPADSRRGRGTVFGYSEFTEFASCGPDCTPGDYGGQTYDGGETCDASCADGTCQLTCAFTCMPTCGVSCLPGDCSPPGDC